MEPTKTWSAGEEPFAADLNRNFTEALNNYRDFTFGETIAVNDALYLKASDGKAYKCDADFGDERITNFIGFAKESGVVNDIKKVQVGGKVTGFSSLTIGSFYFLSGTAGAISVTQGAYVKQVGVAVSATSVLIIKERVNFLGSWTSRNPNSGGASVVFQAGTDLFIVIGRNTSELNWDVYTDSNNPPTTLRGKTRTLAASGLVAGLTIPVKKNNYYKVVVSDLGGTGHFFDTISME